MRVIKQLQRLIIFFLLKNIFFFEYTQMSVLRIIFQKKKKYLFCELVDEPVFVHNFILSQFFYETFLRV